MTYFLAIHYVLSH